jgi:hypothetical protein
MDHNPFFHDASDVTKKLIWLNENSKNTISIGKVMKINASPVSVNIQPLINYYDVITQWEEFPILQNVPVAQLASSVFSLNTPLNVGDTGLILWFDREAYTCLLAGASTTTTPSSGALNNVNACVFIPILQSFALANTLEPSGVDIISSDVSLLTQLLNLSNSLTTLATALVTAGNAYIAAPTLPNVLVYVTAVNAAATSLNTAIAQVTTMLTTFKGAQS